MDEKRIDSIFSSWSKGVCPGGQVLVRVKGEIVYQKNFGYANLEHRVKVTDQTVFHVASVSKQITVMCILLLHKEGKLSIDDDIRKYVSDLVCFSEPVTLRDLMNNVSGIRDQWELLYLSGVRIIDTISQKDALNSIKNQRQLNFEPRSQFLYSNSNFTLLAEIVERVSEKSLNDFADEKLFKPLGMHHTQFKDDFMKIIENRADSYFDKGNNQYYHSVLNYGTYGATSLNTTTTDFIKWMDQFRTPTICDRELLDIMYTVPTLKDGSKSNYACGLFVGEYNGYKYIEHGGADASYRSQMLRFLDEDIDIVIFSNTRNIGLKDAVFKIADSLLNTKEEELDDSQYFQSDYNQRDANGYYFSDELSYGIEIISKDDNPHVEVKHDLVPLRHIGGNHYKINHLNLDIYFGAIAYIKLRDGFKPLRKIATTSLNEINLDKYVGKYISDELDTFYYITYNEGKLYIKHRRHGKHVLYPIGNEQYFVDGLSVVLKFQIENEVVKNMIMSGSRVKSLLLDKEN